MQRDLAYLVDILDSATLILEYVAGRTEAEFLGETSLQDQVARRFEIIGEAARQISDETKKDLPRIPWREIIGLRNILIHEYGEVNYARIWETIREDLPDLITQIKSHTS